MDGDNVSRPASRRRYSPWAMAAVVTALIALLLQGGLVPLNIAAAVLGLVGLRHIRRQPERFIGRGFCWIAIGLALILATLTAMVEPTPPPAVLDDVMVPE